MLSSSVPSADDPGKAPQVAERRAWVRYPRRLEMLWQIFGMRKEDLWPAAVQDVSATGVGLILHQTFPPGTVLAIRLQTGAGRSRPFLIRVQHVTPLGGDQFQVGCTFVVPLGEDVLRSLLA